MNLSPRPRSLHLGASTIFGVGPSGPGPVPRAKTMACAITVRVTQDAPRVAARLAEEVLWPAAAAIEAADRVPAQYLDALAQAGLYDLPADPPSAGAVVEALAGASLATAFVWIQHHGPLRLLEAVGGPLADRYLGPMRRGELRAGIAYAALRRPGPPAVRAHPQGEAWVLDGHAPWVTGWGLVDLMLVGARHQGTLTDPAGPQVDQMVWCLLPARERPGLEATRLRLEVLEASSTFRLDFDGTLVPPEEVVLVESFERWRQRDRAGRSLNGHLALGVASRACELAGSDELAKQVSLLRDQLLEGDPGQVAGLRAAASLLALRAAAALVATGGGRSVEKGSHAARLMREATFLIVFGQTADIRAAQLAGLERLGP